MPDFSLNKLKYFLMKSGECRRNESKEGKVRESRRSFQAVNDKLTLYNNSAPSPTPHHLNHTAHKCDSISLEFVRNTGHQVFPQIYWMRISSGRVQELVFYQIYSWFLFMLKCENPFSMPRFCDNLSPVLHAPWSYRAVWIRWTVKMVVTENPIKNGSTLFIHNVVCERPDFPFLMFWIANLNTFKMHYLIKYKTWVKVKVFLFRPNSFFFIFPHKVPSCLLQIIQWKCFPHCISGCTRSQALKIILFSVSFLWQDLAKRL